MGTYLRGILTLAALLAALLFGGCGSTVPLQSAPRPENGQVDGRPEEWSQGLKVFQDQGVQVGVQNDSANVYLCLRAFERSTARGILVAGLTVWFDRQGGSKERWGIRFPVGIASFPRTGEEPTIPPSGGESIRERSILEGRVKESLGDLQIVGPKDDDRVDVSTLTCNREYGIDVAMRDSQSVLTYELKIPRQFKESKYVLGVIPDGILGVEIETNALERQALERRREGGGEESPPMGMGGGRRGMGGRGGFGRSRSGSPPERGSEPQKVSLSLKVTLTQGSRPAATGAVQ